MDYCKTKAKFAQDARDYQVLERSSRTSADYFQAKRERAERRRDNHMAECPICQGAKA